jgi:hypothetical protein
LLNRRGCLDFNTICHSVVLPAPATTGGELGASVAVSV